MQRQTLYKNIKMQPFISIITPVKNESSYIVECINSLLSLDYPKNSYEIIIILDKNATKEVENALAVFKDKINIARSKKAGSAANRNFGVSIADKKSRYFAFTDADCVASKGWLKSLASRMEKAGKEDKKIGCIGGLNLVPESDNDFAKVIGAIEQTLLGGGGSAQGSISGNERFVPSIPNCNALYRRELWMKNRQDERLIIGQDGEFNYRLSKQGNKFLVIPNAVVWHHRTNNLKGYVKRMYKYGVAAARISRMHPGILKVRWYALLSLIAMFIALILLIVSLKTFLVLAIVYIATLLLTTLQVIIKTKKPAALLTPVLLFLQHVLYNAGFLAGLLK